MIGRFDTEKLNELLRDFYTAVGIKISVFDENFKMVTEYPPAPPEFCRLVRESDAGRRGCAECDAAACERAKRLREPHVYTCHAGVTEAITPICVGGGIIGYAILAHMMPKENYAQAVNSACVRAARYGGDEKAYFDAVTKIEPKSEKQIHACVHLLDAVASYVYIKDLAQWGKEDESAAIDDYIRGNLTADLSSEALCRKFLVSRTKLYQLSVRRFGMGIAQYVAMRRMEEAKRLLREGKSITAAAAKTGFSDYSYFCKAFKKYTGKTPAQYRNG